MRARIVVLAMLLAIRASAFAAPVRLRAPDGTVREVPIESVEYALKDGYTRFSQVYVRSPDGTVSTIDDDLVAAAERAGFWRMTASEIDAHRVEVDTAAKQAAKETKSEAVGPIRLQNKDGQVIEVDGADVRFYTSRGYVIETPEMHFQALKDDADRLNADEASDRQTQIWIAVIGAAVLVSACVLFLRRYSQR